MNKPSVVYDTPNHQAPAQNLMQKQEANLHVTVAFGADADPAEIIHNMQLKPEEVPGVAINYLALGTGTRATLPVLSFPDGNTLQIDRSAKGADTDLSIDVMIGRPVYKSDPYVAPKK